MRFEAFLCVALIITNKGVFGAPDGWDEKLFEPSTGVEVTETGADKISIKLEEEMPIGTKLGKLLYSGDGAPEVQSDYFLLDKDTWELSINKRMDYEADHEIIVRVTQSSFILTFEINLININDNPIQISGGKCTENENNPEPFTTSCSYNIKDDDGLSKELKFVFDSAGKFDRFTMSKDAKDLEGKYAIELKLVFLEKEDFETENTVALTWTASDEKHAESLLIIVNIEDVNDEPPIWQTNFGTIQIDEEEKRELELVAKDGDVKIDVEIEYELDCKNCFCDSLSISKSKLIIKKIILDDPSQNTCQFSIIAREKEKIDENQFETPQEIFLQIRDINNMKPEITINSKSIPIKEGHSDELLKFTVNDKDSGSYGRYNVKLASDAFPNIDDVLQIIPGIGYQENEFSIIVKDPSKLDYDDVDLKNPFVITIKTDDAMNKDEDSIEITLLDINDEKPIWKETSYEVNKQETFGRTSSEKIEIENFSATDRDKEEVYNTIVYTLESKTDRFKLIPPTSPGDSLILETVYDPKIPQFFDFEREKFEILTILASDVGDENNDANITPVQLKINIDDVNDEMPTLSADKTTIPLDEYTKDTPSPIGIKLSAKDNDKESNLQYKIDDTKSYVLKLGTEYSWIDNVCIDINPEDGDLTLTTPLDYQKFDTIYLVVQVEDLNAEDPKPQIVDLTIIINVKNLPNLPLEIAETSLKDLFVVEHSEKNTIIGVVVATDPDAPGFDSIVYSIKPSDEFVIIDSETGKLTVASDIDADKTVDFPNGREKLSYTVTVKSGQRKTTKKFDITIIDINDSPPVPDKKSYTYNIEEMSDQFDAPNEPIFVVDKDREDRNTEYTCSIKATSDQNVNNIYQVKNEVQNYRKTCTLTVKDRDKIIWTKDNYKHSFEVTITNIELVATVKVVVTIFDKENHDPKVKEDQVFIASEFDSAGETIGTIEGIDEDSDEFAHIEYKIIDIEKLPDNFKTDLSAHFEIMPDQEEVRNGILKVVQPLKGCYGTYTVKLSARNYPHSGTKNARELGSVKLTIEKYNFNDVIFVTTETRFLLSDRQFPNQPLRLWGTTQTMENIIADDKQENKYTIKYTIVEGMNSDREKDEYFKIQHINNEAQLQLKSEVQPDGWYTLYLKAEQLDAAPQRNADWIEIKVGLYNEDVQPKFETLTWDCNTEEDHKGPFDCILPRATQFGEEKAFSNKEDEKTIKYYVIESVPENTFTIADPTTTQAEIINAIDLASLEQETQIYFKVEATYANGPTGTASNDSVIHVTVDVEDTNNHPPEFPKKNVLDVLLIGQVINKLRIDLAANDPDINDVLSYHIDEDSYDVSENGNLPAFSTKPFVIKKVNNRRSELQSNFDVLSSMTGLITFNVMVQDKYKDEDPHEDYMSLELYVISDVHLCPIVFENQLSQVEDLKEEINAILAEKFECLVGIVEIKPTKSTFDNEGITTTEVIAYFIDADEKVGIKNEVIKAKINTFSFYADIRNAFLDLGMVLKNVIVPAEAESNEESYKLALIIVSCVSGVVIIGLIALFTCKIRSTNSCLDRLDQAEVKRPTVFQNLPGANRRATQVVNPNISQLEDDTVSNDLSFTQSPWTSSKMPFDDDEEENFVGVENSDIFKISNH